MIRMEEILKSEVPEESPHIRVAVRHPTEGFRSRRFSMEEKFKEVYIWVGSLSPKPEFFVLKDHHKHLEKKDVVHSGTFLVIEVDEDRDDEAPRMLRERRRLN